MQTQELSDSLALVEIEPGFRVSVATLKEWLPDTETLFFFAQVFDLDYRMLSHLLRVLFQTDVVQALTSGEHSTELQDYLVHTVPDHVIEVAQSVTFVDAAPKAEILPELWKTVQIEVLTSLKEVGKKVGKTMAKLPSKQGEMIIKTMMKVNKQRPTLGVSSPFIRHQQVAKVLVIFDVSGSMSRQTVETIANEVVGLSWEANADLAIVSDHCFHWTAGSYNTKDVLAQAEYSGTQYETLAPLFDEDWDVVICIADYDSSPGAKQALARQKGKVGEVFDISLVNKPTYLAECVGQLADAVTPLFITNVVSPRYLEN